MTNTPLEINRKQDESIDDYLLRLGGNKDIYSLNWVQVAERMNAESNEDFGESKWRKDFFLIKKGYELAIKNNISENEVLQELEDKTLQFQKQKFQYQDQKREYTNVVRQQARFEHLKDEIKQSIKELEKVKPLVFSPVRDNGLNIRANVLFSDFHYGQTSNNTLNTYNPEVFNRRFEHLVSKTIHYCKKHNVSELTIGSLGDQVSGYIHTTSRIEQSEDVVSQTQYISERLSEAVAEISKHVAKVKIINLIGNHSRTSPNKHDSIMKENFENLIPWYMESRLKDFKNVEILKSEDGYFVDYSFPEPQVYVHGDVDYVSSVAKSLPQFLGVIAKYIWMGHIHHDTVKDHGRTTVVSNGSVCGSDSYAVSKRMYSEAMQKMHIFDENGRIEYKIDILLQDIK